MFTSNPFADSTVFLPPLVMQVYIVLMVLAVAAGTLFDMLHKKSAKFFLRQWKKSKAAAKRKIGGAETASLAARILLKEVASSGEFHNPMRGISHLLMFYGFLLYLTTTIWFGWSCCESRVRCLFMEFYSNDQAKDGLFVRDGTRIA